MSFSDGSADFRSDTVTRPTPEMRAAMANAEVGDDVYSDDPTVNALEEESAAVVGKKAAVYVPTGTMGNQLAIMLQTRPGDDVLCDPGIHSRNIEKGAASALSGVSFRVVDAPDGRMTPDQIDEAMAMVGFFPRIHLMVWENTHNLSGGKVVPIEVIEEGSTAGRRHGLSIHLDGARIFNAVAASGVAADRYAAAADTVQFCFSKGLGAPVGSILCGPDSLIGEARNLRKRLGGAMRQAGVIASAARIALRDRERLGEDHDLASYLVDELAGVVGEAVDPKQVETNMVQIDATRLPVAFPVWAEHLQKSGIKVNPPFGTTIRLVTHRDVDTDDVDRLVASLAAAIDQGP
ncbi:MAG TPA: GntG family PLP-dependent aldolase [Acidimicrobiia bacterium]|nr:GntG family PLP-dependent aldolase [Acidimicrobiia bacterium]